MSDKYQEQIEVDLVAELYTAMLDAAAKIVNAHGDDPNTEPLMVAAVSLMIKAIGDGGHPNFPIAVREMLAKWKPKS